MLVKPKCPRCDAELDEHAIANWLMSATLLTIIELQLILARQGVNMQFQTAEVQLIEEQP